MTEYKKRWRRAAGGAMAGTAVAGGLLLSGSTPTLARDRRGRWPGRPTAGLLARPGR